MTLVVHASDPTSLIESTFARIERERMQGVPLLNAALQVKVADVERWDGQWLAALVTPWFLNLLLLPGDAARWRPGREGERVFHRFAVERLDESDALQALALIDELAGSAGQHWGAAP